MDKILQEIKLHTASRTLELIFDDGSHYELAFEYLRVHSPSAEVRGHSGQPKLIKDKHNVRIIAIEPVGSYAVKLIFDDGHRTGLYTFDYLYELAKNYRANWEAYLKRVNAE